MARLEGSKRTGWLLLAIVVGHIVLISAHVNTRRGVPLLEAVTFGVFSEVQRAAAWAVGGLRDGWQNYVAVGDIREENERLSAELAQLQIALQQERALARQSRVLGDLLDLRTAVPLETTAASIVATGASPEFRTVTIDKGTRDGVRSDMAVIAPAGVVGRVITPGARASLVQLLVDRNAAAGAMVERSRVQGLAVGQGTDRLRLEYVSDTADVEVGDRVITSGIEGIYPSSLSDGTYPQGFLIGRIESIQRVGDRNGTIVIRPAVDFGTLESVLIVLTPPAGASASIGDP